MTWLSKAFFAVICLLAAQAYAKDVSIHYGYIDQRPYDQVIDHNLAQELLSKLVRACSFLTEKTCGFDVIFSHGNMIVLENSKNQITIFTSSISDSDNDNRNNLNSEQSILSDTAEGQFHESLQSREAIIYVGHSRFGSGPDFMYPQIRSSDGKVDKAYYLANHKGGLRAVKALDHSQLSYQEIALISCDAEKHFLQQLKAKFPNKKFYFAEGLQYPSQLTEAVSKNLNQLLN